MGALAGEAAGAGVVSNVRQLSRSVVSASLQVGEQIEGGGVWRALAGSGGSEGARTVGGEVVGKFALQPLASSASTIGVGSNSGQCGFGLALDSVTVFKQFPFCDAVGFGLLARQALGLGALSGQRGGGFARYLVGIGQALGLHQQADSECERDELPSIAHHCAPMHAAWRLSCRVQTPPHSLLPGIEQSNPAENLYSSRALHAAA